MKITTTLIQDNVHHHEDIVDDDGKIVEVRPVLKSRNGIKARLAVSDASPGEIVEGSLRISRCLDDGGREAVADHAFTVGVDPSGNGAVDTVVVRVRPGRHVAKINDSSIDAPEASIEIVDLDRSNQ